MIYRRDWSDIRDKVSVALRSLARRSRGASLVGIAFDTLFARARGEGAAEAARKLGLEPRMIEGGAFDAMRRWRASSPIILPAGPMFLRDRTVIAQALLERRIPVHRGHQAGCQSRPTLPIEQSPRFYMAINLKTAALLGVFFCRMCSSLGPTRWRE